MNLTKRITRRIFLSDTKMAVLLQHAEFFMIRQKVSISLEELLFYRGTGLGSLLLTEAQSYVTAKNAAKIGISAQVRAAGFYETLGFVRQGEEYLEENCPHIYMEKTL